MKQFSNWEFVVASADNFKTFAVRPRKMNDKNNRSTIQEGGNGNNNCGDGTRNENNLKPPVTGELVDVLVPPAEDLDGKYVNADEVNLMKRTTIDVTVAHGTSHDPEEGKSGKPSTYAAKKTVAQGMIDIALLTSNANQLKNLITYERGTPTFYFVMLLIILSLGLQITVGIFLIFKGRFDTKGKNKGAAARVNKQIMAAVFLITIINIFIAIFSIPENTQPFEKASKTTI